MRGLDTDQGFMPFRWRSPIHMPRRACRLLLEVAGVRVERLHSITEADAVAEGFEASRRHSARMQFVRRWDEINGGRGFGWDGNPWVWVLDFKRLERTDG